MATGQHGTVVGPGGYTDQVKVEWDNGSESTVLSPTIQKKFGETDEYLVQALVDAWHKNDENAYFDAENAIIQHLGQPVKLKPGEQGGTLFEENA